MSKTVKRQPLPKFERWAFTTWQEPNPKRLDLFRFIVWQREKSMNGEGKIHYQGYCEFTSSYDQGAVKRLFKQPGMHLEPAKESRAVNMFYCLKPDTYNGKRYLLDDNGEQHVYNMFNEMKNYDKKKEIEDDYSLSDVFDLE